MELSQDEKKLLAFLVEKELEEFTKEGKTVMDNMSLSFVKSEAMSEEFLKELLKKLK